MGVGGWAGSHPTEFEISLSRQCCSRSQHSALSPLIHYRTIRIAQSSSCVEHYIGSSKSMPCSYIAQCVMPCTSSKTSTSLLSVHICCVFCFYVQFLIRPILNNNKDEIIEKYKLKKNRQEIWSYFTMDWTHDHVANSTDQPVAAIQCNKIAIISAL